jgi:hypothetical protein
MISKMKGMLLGITIWSCLGLAKAQPENPDIFKHSLYVGAMGGFGSTTWQGLMPKVNVQNSALSLSTPIAVHEGGGVWGFTAGYEFTPCFAIEGNYMFFPDAKLEFDEDSLYAFDNNDETVLITKTQTGSLSAKVMLVLPRTNMRVFSSAGIATVIRDDVVNKVYRISPVFAFGVNLLVTDRVMVELGSNYTAGYGESEINPVEDFVPFLYSIFIKGAIRF